MGIDSAPASTDGGIETSDSAFKQGPPSLRELGADASEISYTEEGGITEGGGGGGGGGGSFTWTPALICISIALFILAGVFEVGGGYLVWLGIREKRTPRALYIVLGSVVLICYGFIPTLQPSPSFGR